MNKTFNIEHLSELIQHKCPFIWFAYIFGSARNGSIKQNSDIDIAVYLSATTYKEQAIIGINQCNEILNPGTEVDIVFLNNANPVLAFESLKGRRLFVRNEALDVYAGFYSLTCREYESENYWMQQQLKYRNYEVQWGN